MMAAITAAVVDLNKIIPIKGTVSGISSDNAVPLKSICLIKYYIVKKQTAPKTKFFKPELNELS